MTTSQDPQWVRDEELAKSGGAEAVWKEWPNEPVTDVDPMDDVAGYVTGAQWGARCRVDGTSMKLWGRVLPGGFGVTGWK